MKVRRYILGIVIVCLLGTGVFLYRTGIYVLVYNYVRYGNIFGDEFISPTEAAVKWGNDKFDANRFRKPHEFDRAPMIADLIKSKQLIGTKYKDIEGILGARDGDYYYYDEILTYQVVQIIDSVTKLPRESYDLVILQDNQGYVEQLLLWKSCCKH